MGMLSVTLSFETTFVDDATLRLSGALLGVLSSGERIASDYLTCVACAAKVCSDTCTYFNLQPIRQPIVNQARESHTAVG